MRIIVLLLLTVLPGLPLLAEVPANVAHRVPGDLNADGKVDAADRTLMGAYLAENAGLSGFGLENASLDGVPGTTVADHLMMRFLPDVFRGQLISTASAGTLLKLQSNFYLNLAGLSNYTPVLYDVDLVRVEYWTIDPFRRWTSGSGLAAFPRLAPGPVPVLSVQHGTEVEKAKSPSSGQNSELTVEIAAMAAAGGYAISATDYLGLGTSPGLHPYVHADSEATASLDMLRAFRLVAAERQAGLNNKLFISGYSQGGHATMALFRELETWHADEFPLTAAAPAAGPYDLSGTMIDHILQNPTPYSALSYYLAYTILSYDMVYGLFDDLSEVFVPPYDEQVPALYDGTHSATEIYAALPPVAADMLQPAFRLAVMNNPDHPLRQALAQNNLYDWAPSAPVRLYHGKADQDVPYANSEVAAARMQELGVPVILVNLGDNLNHSTAAIPALVAIRTWFDTLK